MAENNNSQNNKKPPIPSNSKKNGRGFNFYWIYGILAVVFIALQYLGDNGNVLDGFIKLTEKAPEKFDMILSKDNPQYINLPGISVLIGGMWVANLYYFGCNQYIIQRALAAKSIKQADPRRRGSNTELIDLFASARMHADKDLFAEFF